MSTDSRPTPLDWNGILKGLVDKLPIILIVGVVLFLGLRYLEHDRERNNFARDRDGILVPLPKLCPDCKRPDCLCPLRLPERRRQQGDLPVAPTGDFRDNRDQAPTRRVIDPGRDWHTASLVHAQAARPHRNFQGVPWLLGGESPCRWDRAALASTPRVRPRIVQASSSWLSPPPGRSRDRDSRRVQRRHLGGHSGKHLARNTLA